jgi:integrase
MKHLSTDRLQSLLDVCDDRDTLMVTLAYEHGMRVSELLALTPGDFARGFLTLRRLKGSRKTTQRVAEPPLAKVKAYAASQGLEPTDRLFPITRQAAHAAMRRNCEVAGIPRHLAHMHSLKHSLGHHLLDAGTPLPVVQAALGHKSLASTGQYLVADDSTADEARAKTFAQARQ